MRKPYTRANTSAARHRSKRDTGAYTERPSAREKRKCAKHISGGILALSHELFRICHRTNTNQHPNKNRKVKRCKLMSKRNPIWNVINVLSLCAFHSLAALRTINGIKCSARDRHKLNQVVGNRWQSANTVCVSEILSIQLESNRVLVGFPAQLFF